MRINVIKYFIIRFILFGRSSDEVGLTESGRLVKAHSGAREGSPEYPEKNGRSCLLDLGGEHRYMRK